VAFNFRFLFMSPLYIVTVTGQWYKKLYIHLMLTGRILSAVLNILMNTP